MARIFKDSSVLNQFGSPSLNSNTLANRPAFGQPGRLFVDTTNNVIYRDTGTSWALITGGAGSIPNLQQVTTIGNTTDQGINVLSNSGLYVTSDSTTTNRPTTYPFALYAVGFNVLKSTYNVNNANINVAAILQSNINVNISSTKNTFFNANFSNLDLNIPTGSTLTLDVNANNGSILALNSFSGTGGGSIVNNQAGGSGFRAISPLISKTNYTDLSNNINIDYYAGINIYGAEGITSNIIYTGKLSIDQYYSILINPSDYFANSPIITGNRWGIYQAGANDVNYFASKVLIGTSTPDFNQFYCNGPATINSGLVISNFEDSLLPIAGGLRLWTNQGASSSFIEAGKRGVAGYSLTIGGNPINFKNSNSGSQIATFLNDNFLIGTATNTNSVKLKVNGEQEWSNITYGTGVHTTSGNHLPIWVNGTKYWLALLNPPVLP
jgi:hypothetical protein